ncbi:hypothetical protein Btru_031274 [Bulinus truncatus]|nr:hypothetical protein Btru_031274 [Bulinus truncatus]
MVDETFRNGTALDYRNGTALDYRNGTALDYRNGTALDYRVPNSVRYEMIYKRAMATLTSLIEMGKDLGYTGKELRDWIVNMAENLKFYADGKEQNFLERIRQEGAKFYTDIGVKTWRVPPVKFNVMKTLKACSDSCKVIGKVQQTDQETNSAENIVCGSFENLSKYLVDKQLDSAMFIVSNFEYDNYLNKINLLNLELNSTQEERKSRMETLSNIALKLPKDVAQRGELDVLILHQNAGILLVQTKAVGYSFPCSDTDLDGAYISNIHKAIEKAVNQLLRDCLVILHVMDDLQLQENQLTKLIALPKLRRCFLEKALQKCESLRAMIENKQLDPNLHFLCKEDFMCDNSGWQKNLENWWSLKLQPRKLKLETMKEIAYRTVGLMSTVSVWSSSQPRMEVRNLNDAAWETGNRFTQVLLSSQQAELLKKDEKYFYVWGPAGSGKTLLLSLKGHQWLKKHSVVILNTRLGSKGRTVGHVMESTINKTIENSGSKKSKLNKAMRIDIDLAEDEKSIESEVLRNIDKQKNPMFLIDEVTWIPETGKLIQILKTHSPQSTIWCAGMLPECKPDGFESQELQAILRCPPSVQRVLRLVDNRKERQSLYHLDSSKAGLPTDGPSPYFIIHSKHGRPEVQPYDCVMCAELLSEFLLNNLNLKKVLLSHDVEGCRLHFNDAVLAVSMPQSWHHYTERGYWAISREALHSNMMLLGSGPFCQTLLDKQIPLKVEGAMTFTPDKNVQTQTFAMCPIGSVHGLEYKVVVCMPSARDLPEFTEINEGIVEGLKEPRVPMKRLPFATEIMKKRLESLSQGPEFCICLPKNGTVYVNNSAVLDSEPKSDKIRISTHVHGYYIDHNGTKRPLDLLYEECKDATGPVTLDSGKQKHSETCLKKLKDEICGKIHKDENNTAKSISDEIKTNKNSLDECNSDDCVCRKFSSEELVALHKLDQWDKAYVLMCASRCTSQLILVLP